MVSNAVAHTTDDGWQHVLTQQRYISSEENLSSGYEKTFEVIQETLAEVKKNIKKHIESENEKEAHRFLSLAAKTAEEKLPRKDGALQFFS